MPDQITAAKEAKKDLETEIQQALNKYMANHNVCVVRIGLHAEEYFNPPFVSSVDVEVKI